ncbi:unnamed protein product [Meganyctiphanes norvegica]|uniref:Proteasome assembly chaperone 4 n=1 Tax=Meganyctiphanes norvegica TaxID=48144 RepID=A0AAV2PN40_MEGNR
MANIQEVPTNMHVTEFCSDIGERTIYYHLLHMSGSVYAWVGTEQANMGSMVTALATRVGPPASATLLGPSSVGSHAWSQVAQRLHSRTGQQVLLSVNLPNDDVLPQVEQRLLEELCMA